MKKVRAVQEIKCGRSLSEKGFKPHKLVSMLQPGNVLDIGAAAGSETLHYLKMDAECKIWAFEPFPGNWPHIDSALGDNHRVTIIKKAASDVVGIERFHVSSQVSGDDDTPWRTKAGYSSVGRLVNRDYKAAMGVVIEVETIRVDDVVEPQEISHMKIDVQGAESRVLKGAARLLNHGRVKSLLVEYSAQPNVIELLGGYEIYDQEYMIVNQKNLPVDHSIWDVTGEHVLSTGVTSLKAWPKVEDRTAIPELLADQKKYFGYVQTDLLCIKADLEYLLEQET